MPRRRTLSLYLRGRPGALLLTAARLARHSAGEVHRRRHPPRVPHRKRLRAELHRLLRPSGVVHGPLARPANHPHHPATTGRRRTARADRVSDAPMMLRGRHTHNVVAIASNCPTLLWVERRFSAASYRTRPPPG